MEKYMHFKISQRFIVGKGFEMKAFLNGKLLDSVINLHAHTWSNITVYMGHPGHLSADQQGIKGFIKNFEYKNFDEGEKMNMTILF